MDHMAGLSLLPTVVLRVFKKETVQGDVMMPNMSAKIQDSGLPPVKKNKVVKDRLRAWV